MMDGGLFVAARSGENKTNKDAIHNLKICLEYAGFRSNIVPNVMRDIGMDKRVSSKRANAKKISNTGTAS